MVGPWLDEVPDLAIATRGSLMPMSAYMANLRIKIGVDLLLMLFMISSADFTGLNRGTRSGRRNRVGQIS